MIPKKLEYIVHSVVKQFQEKGGTLPPLLMLRGESGVGKSWILYKIKKHIMEMGEDHGLLPLFFNRLTAHNVVNEINLQVDRQGREFLFKNKSRDKRMKNLRFVLLWDSFDDLYNVSRPYGKPSLPQNVKGASAPILQRIKFSAELRSYLTENAGKVTLIGTTNNVDFMSNEDLPFFNFFNIINVNPLSYDESFKYINEKISRDEKAKELFEIFTESTHDSLSIDICDGKISYLNIFASSLLEAVETNYGQIDQLMDTYSLFFMKLNPEMKGIISTLSENEKIVLRHGVKFLGHFYQKDFPTLDLNLSQLIKNLVRKKIFNQKDKVLSMKSHALKMWVRYREDSDSISISE